MKKYIILIILSLGCWVGIHAQTPQKMTYVYDALNRLTEVTYPNGSKITYNYDVLGNRTSVVTVGSTPTCAVPTGIQWQNTTATSFQPYWNGIAGYNYIVHYRVSGTTTWTETAQIPCTTSGIIQATLSGLTNGTTYEWQIKTVCSVGNESAYSASINSSTFCQPANLSTPTGSQITSTTVYLTWNSFGIPLNVNLRWRVVGTTLWNTANNLSGTNNTLTGLLPSSNYEVQIQTICADGSLSAFSTSRNFTTLCALPVATLSGTQTITAGQTANLSVALTGVAPWSIIMNGTTYTVSASPFSISVSPSITTTYTLTSVSNSCGAGTVSGSALVTVNACTSMYTLKTGSWNDITVWSCGRVPMSTDIITVKLNHFITIPASYTANAKNVVYETGGKIIEAANTSKLCLSCTATIPTNGLMIHLPFNGNANDASGNNNNGVVTGTTLGNDRFGVANKAYRFNDGNNITVTNSASLSLVNAFSVSVWVNMQSTTGRDGNGAISTTPEQCIFTKNCDNGQLRNAIFPQANGTFLLQTWANTGDQITIPFQLNQWKLISLTYDGSTLKQFVDGNLVSTKAVVLSLALSNNYNLVIGNMGCWVYYFNGFMDEFRMYNRGLSNSEVLDIYNGEKP
jgi:YD repeat-containing protein